MSLVISNDGSFIVIQSNLLIKALSFDENIYTIKPDSFMYDVSNNYVLNKKITLAKRLLLNTNLSVKQISEKLSLLSDAPFITVTVSTVWTSPI